MATPLKLKPLVFWTLDDSWLKRRWIKDEQHSKSWDVVSHMMLSESEKPKTLENEETSNHYAAVLLNMELDHILVDRAMVWLEVK